MCKKLVFFFIISTSLSNFYCKNDPAQQQQQTNNSNSAAIVKNYDELANSYCECSEKLVALNKKMLQLQAEDKAEEMGELLPEVELESEKREACRTQLELQYAVQIHENKEVLLAIKKKCADLGTFMENATKIAE